MRPTAAPTVPIASAISVAAPSVLPTRRAVAAGITTKLETSTTPTVLTATTTTTAVSASRRYSSIATGTPEIAASSGSKMAYAKRDQSSSVTTHATTATATTTYSTVGVTDSMLPNSRCSTCTGRSAAV